MAFQEPPGDADFTAAVNDFITFANANLADIGLVAADMTPLTTIFPDWEAGYAEHITKQAAAEAATSNKNALRVAVRMVLRVIVAKAEGSGMLNDAERNALHLTVADTVRTPAPVPTTKPVGVIDTSQRLGHSISFTDELSPGIRRKPDGVLGCEIYVKFGGAPPADDSEVTYLAMDTRSPYLAEYDANESGQIAHYILRWINTRSERGPWSETVSATIGA